MRLGGSAEFSGQGVIGNVARDHDYLKEDIGERAIHRMHEVTPQRAEQTATETSRQAGSKQ